MKAFSHILKWMFIASTLIVGFIFYQSNRERAHSDWEGMMDPVFGLYAYVLEEHNAAIIKIRWRDAEYEITYDSVESGILRTSYHYKNNEIAYITPMGTIWADIPFIIKNGRAQ